FKQVGVVESPYCIKYKKLLSLSEQQVVDCSQQGCNRGNPTYAWVYINEAGGIMEDKDYPYKGMKENCKFNQRASLRVRIVKDKQLASEKSMADEVALHGPIVIIIDVNGSFNRFNGTGIFYEEDCKGNGLHAVIVVGYGTENGVDYWIIKNSWGTSWGNVGYARIRRNVNVCNLKQYAHKADVKA
uniref:Peptidase C1A papain C-terminal domain-containing protein n=1 Tax=Latimeria chalumnae TaxID=7897 RepID=H2ZV95_LATCH